MGGGCRQPAAGRALRQGSWGGMERRDRSSPSIYPRHHLPYPFCTLCFLGEPIGPALLGQPHLLQPTLGFLVSANHLSSPDSKQHEPKNDVSFFFFRVECSVFSKKPWRCMHERGRSTRAQGLFDPGKVGEGRVKVDTQTCDLGQRTQGRVFLELGETGWGACFEAPWLFPLGLELEQPGRCPSGDVQFAVGWKGLWLRMRGPGQGQRPKSQQYRSGGERQGECAVQRR